MAAIASINLKYPVVGAVAAAPTTLSADDTITYDPKVAQVLLLRNPTGGSLTATIDGDGGTTVAVQGVGTVNVAGGLAIAVPASEVRAVKLSTISAYCQGVVHITGGAGLLATVIDLWPASGAGVLVEDGLVRATTSDGTEYTFRPSLGRIASLGSPHEIVSLFASLHDQAPEVPAAMVLAALCDQDDPTPLIGTVEPRGGARPLSSLNDALAAVAADGGVPALFLMPGAMPPSEAVLIARHLMQHGMVGTARPRQVGGGEYSETFDAAQYIAAARVHLGMSEDDASALSMTGLQRLFETKFPPEDKKDEPPSREEYAAALRELEEARGG